MAPPCPPPGPHCAHSCTTLCHPQLETIAAAPDAEEGVGSASETQLLNLAPPQHEDVTTADGSQLTAGRALTKAERGTTLRQLVRDQWLAHCPHQAGHYCIGVSEAGDQGVLCI